MRITLLTWLLAASASASIIPVTGSGSFDREWTGDSGTTVRLSGTDGLHSVGLYAEIYSPFNDTFQNGNLAGSTRLLFSGIGGSATIDGLSSGSFRFGLSNGSGFVDILDRSDFSVMAHADLIGYVRITEQTTLNPGPFFSTSGSFVVVSTPEPSTFALFGTGLLLYGFNLLRRRHDQRTVR